MLHTPGPGSERAKRISSLGVDNLDAAVCIYITSRVDLPTQANFLGCARIATSAFPTMHASGLALGLGLGFRVGLVAAVSRSPKQRHRRGEKMPSSLVTKPCFIKTASLYAGTSQEVRLRGQI